MKVLVFFVFMFSVSVELLSQDQQGPYIAFDRELHDYGEILSDDVPDGKISFTVYNQGDQPLILLSVRACCGTRVIDYTKSPIAPADSGYIEVQFRIVPQPYRIRRTVTIQSNASNEQNSVLRIQGEVILPRGDLRLNDE